MCVDVSVLTACGKCKLVPFFECNARNVHLILFMLTIVVTNKHVINTTAHTYTAGETTILLQIVSCHCSLKVCYNNVIYWQQKLTMTLVDSLSFCRWLAFTLLSVSVREQYTGRASGSCSCCSNAFNSFSQTNKYFLNVMIIYGYLFIIIFNYSYSSSLFYPVPIELCNFFFLDQEDELSRSSHVISVESRRSW